MDAADIAQLDPSTDRGEHDRVRESTTDSINQRIDADALDRVTAYAFASHAEIEARIDELRREWDVERVLQLNAASNIELFRRLGVRTRKEIDREIASLKALRGDFTEVNHPQPAGSPGQLGRAAWEAARV